MFWMVYGENGGAPTYKHETEASAKAEAERLAKLNQGKRFYVLKVIADVVVSNVRWTEHLDLTRSDPSDIPF